MGVLRMTMGLAIGLLLAGCAEVGHQRVGAAGDFRDEPSRIAYRLEVDFRSDIPDPYYLTSGPNESYGQYSLNAAFEAMVREYAALKSTENASRTATLGVHVQKIVFTYDEIGLREWLKENRHAANGLRAPVSGALVLASDAVLRGGDMPIPQEVVKGAEVFGEVEVREGEVVRGRKPFSAELTDRLYWWDFDGRNYYDFKPLMRGVINAAILQIDRIVDALLAAP